MLNATADLKEQLTYLVQLQEIDSELREMEDDRGELPDRIAKQQKELDKTATLLWQTQQSIEKLNARRIDLTREIEEAKSRKRKHEDSLYSVTSNREYDSLTKELDELQKSLGKLAEEQIQVNQDIAQREVEKKQIEEQLVKAKGDIDELQKELSEIVADSSEREEELMGIRAELEAKVLKPIYNHYQRIRLARDGRGIARLAGGACGGCFNQVPPQKVVEVRTFKDFILCEACGRVLVSEDLRG